MLNSPISDFSLLIIVPTKDSFNLLNPLVLSLQKQSFTSWRLIFIDGDSNKLHRQWLDNFTANEPRSKWMIQSNNTKGIFGAMNEGLKEALPNEWVLFWGSDDRAISSDVFERLNSIVNKRYSDCQYPDLLICSARYITIDGSLRRKASFDCQSTKKFRRALFMGSIPPHQSTLFSPRSIRKISNFDESFELAADLNYFLKLSLFPQATIDIADFEIAYLLVGGVSGKRILQRTREVFRAYFQVFKFLWVIPFFIRYIKRILKFIRTI